MQRGVFCISKLMWCCEDLGICAVCRSVTTAYLQGAQLLLPGTWEVQANPDKGEKSQKLASNVFFHFSSFPGCHAPNCLFAPGALSSSVYDYILLFWPCLETVSGCVCSVSFRVRNSKRCTISSVAERKVSADSVIRTVSILQFASSMHGHAQVGRAGKWINGIRTVVLSTFKCLMLVFKAVSFLSQRIVLLVCSRTIHP